MPAPGLRAAAVLAGGRSARFGSDKALAPWPGGVMISAVVRNALEAVPGVLVVAKSIGPLAFLERLDPEGRVRVVEDILEERHALGGLYTALTLSDAPDVFVCACDMPGISPRIIRVLFEAHDRKGAAVPVWGGVPQPLCAVYSVRCLAAIEDLMAAGDLSLGSLLDAVGAVRVPERELARIDPRGLSFRDLDDRASYLAALSAMGPDRRARVEGSAAEGRRGPP